jgi:hypothetical protein
LCITEQTVKQHVKHMMLKTQATTRTGVLAQLLGASRQNTPTRSSSSLRSLSWSPRIQKNPARKVFLLGAEAVSQSLTRLSSASLGGLLSP